MHCMMFSRFFLVTWGWFSLTWKIFRENGFLKMKIDTLISRIFLQKNSRFLQFPQIDGCQIYFNQKFLERGACIFINYILSWFHETYFEWWGISQEGISLCKLCKNLSAARKLEVFNFFAEFLYAVKICCGSSLRITMTCDLEGRWARLKGKQPQQLRHGFQSSETDSTKI